MNLTAYKMDGLGNDFIIIDQRINNIDLPKEKIIKICDHLELKDRTFNGFINWVLKLRKLCPIIYSLSPMIMA